MADFRSQRERIGGLFMVARLYVSDDGVPSMDLVNGHGQMERGVPVPVLGGSAQCYMYMPPTSAAAGVVEATKISGVNGAGILPGLAFPRPAAQVDPEFEPPENDQNYPERHALQDAVFANGGSKVILAKDGSVVIQAPHASPVRIELPINGQVRISQGTGSATQSVPLGGPTLEVLQAHTDAINALAAKVAGLTAEIATAFQLASAAATAAGMPAPTGVAAFVGSLMGSTPAMFSWGGFDRPTPPGEEILSSVFAISDTTAADAAGADTQENL